MIYFVQEDDSRNIKIGRASNVKSRVSGLQNGNSSKLWLLLEADVYNSVEYEKELHRKFSKYRIRGEWFEGSEEILCCIDDMRKFINSPMEQLLDYEQDVDHLISHAGVRTNIVNDLNRYFPDIKVKVTFAKGSGGGKYELTCNISPYGPIDIIKLKQIMNKFVTLDLSNRHIYTQFQYIYGRIDYINVARLHILSSCSYYYDIRYLKDEYGWNDDDVKDGVYALKYNKHKFICVFRSAGTLIGYDRFDSYEEACLFFEKTKTISLHEYYKLS